MNASFTLHVDLIKHQRFIWGSAHTRFGVGPPTSLIGPCQLRENIVCVCVCHCQIYKQKQVEHVINEKRILQAISFPFIVKLDFSFQASLYTSSPSYLCFVLSESCQQIRLIERDIVYHWRFHAGVGGGG